jgi:hypothetical protein
LSKGGFLTRKKNGKRKEEKRPFLEAWCYAGAQSLTLALYAGAASHLQAGRDPAYPGGPSRMAPRSPESGTCARGGLGYSSPVRHTCGPGVLVRISPTRCLSMSKGSGLGSPVLQITPAQDHLTTGTPGGFLECLFRNPLRKKGVSRSQVPDRHAVQIGERPMRWRFGHENASVLNSPRPDWEMLMVTEKFSVAALLTDHLGSVDFGPASARSMRREAATFISDRLRCAQPPWSSMSESAHAHRHVEMDVM